MQGEKSGNVGRIFREYDTWLARATSLQDTTFLVYIKGYLASLSFNFILKIEPSSLYQQSSIFSWSSVQCF